MKPMLASDLVLEKLKFPLIVQPKIDGVRALNMDGLLTGRSLKQFGNRFITKQFSIPELVSLDGEMAAQECTHPDLCRITTSALGTHEGEPYVEWWLFDCLTKNVIHLNYERRYEELNKRLESAYRNAPWIAKHLKIVPSAFVKNLDELLQLENNALEFGYEGIIVRAIDGAHKQGRSTVREGGLLRLKRFVDFEFRITGFEEGMHNANDAIVNALGQIERSSHQANMIPNGMIGNLQGLVIGDVADPTTGNVIFKDGQEVTISPGCMVHDARKFYFQNPNQLIGLIGKAKFFPKGIKDKPRFPTFQCFRDKADMS